MAEVWVLGIEIGGTKLQLGIGQGRGDLVARERLRVDPSRGAAGILNQIQEAFPPLASNSRAGKVLHVELRVAPLGFLLEA